MKDIILNQFFYEDIEEVNDREKKHEIYYFLEWWLNTQEYWSFK